MMMMRLSALSSLLLLPGAVVVAQGPGGAGGPIDTDYPTVLAAAEAALAVYSAPQADLLMATNREGDMTHAVQLSEDTDNNLCIVAYRGPDAGFGWITDIDMRLSYVEVRQPPGKKRRACRVVRHYKNLYFNTKYPDPITSDVEDFVQDCLGDSKRMVATGHDLGGAIATIGAIEHAFNPNILTLAFGTPPVFMPAQYVNPVRLGKGPRKKHPCKHMHNERYVTFITSETPTAEKMVYDFMSYLNFVIYFHIDNEGSSNPVMTPTCIAEAATKTEEFLNSPARGNLGSLFGNSYLFPDPSLSTQQTSWLPVTRFEDRQKELSPGVFKTVKTDRKLISFGNQRINWVVHGDFNSPELLVNTGCGPGDVPEIHTMEYYLARIQQRAPPDIPLPGVFGTEPGFVSILCALATDCVSLICQDLFDNDGNLLPAPACETPGARPPGGRPPNRFPMQRGRGRK